MNTFKATALVLGLAISATACGMDFDSELAALAGLPAKQAIQAFEDMENQAFIRAASATRKAVKTPTMMPAALRRQPTTPAADITTTFRPVSRTTEVVSAPTSRAATPLTITAMRPVSLIVVAARTAQVDQFTGRISPMALIKARAELTKQN